MAEFFRDLADRFYLNFIAEDRWHYITDGLLTTIKVTSASLLVGVLLGFIVAIIRSTHDKTGKMKIGNFICRV